MSVAATCEENGDINKLSAVTFLISPWKTREIFTYTAGGGGVMVVTEEVGCRV